MIATFDYFNLSESCDYSDYGYLEICDDYECRYHYCDPGTLHLYGSYIEFDYMTYNSGIPGFGFNATFEIVGNSTRTTSSTTTTTANWGRDG